MNIITAVLVDDQPFFRAGVRQALSEQSDIRILDCDLSQDPMELIEYNLPNVVLLGSNLATLSRLELAKKIALCYPNTKVIVLSPNPDDEELFEVIKTAAVACLSKNTTAEDLIRTIKRASNGEYPINDSLTARPLVAKYVLRQFQDLASIGKGMETIAASLTHRETQILGHIADGKTNKQIAIILNISEYTIKNHISGILRKLNANDRAHAVVLAIRHGLISVETIPGV